MGDDPRMCVQVLGAGQYNGQFVVFDTRQGSTPVDATPIEKSHRHGSFPFDCPFSMHVHLQTSRISHCILAATRELLQCNFRMQVLTHPCSQHVSIRQCSADPFMHLASPGRLKLLNSRYPWHWLLAKPGFRIQIQMYIEKTTFCTAQGPDMSFCVAEDRMPACRVDLMCSLAHLSLCTPDDNCATILWYLKL